MKKQTTTDLLHTEFPKPDAFGAISMPVYNTASFEFDSAEAMQNAFSGNSDRPVYSRITNPTVEHFENRVKNITDAPYVTAVNSGMAAISAVFLSIAKTGANVITSRHLFGNTYSFFSSTLTAFGVEIRFCDLKNIDEINQNIDSNTCALFFEIITNPQMEVVDIHAISDVCKTYQIPLIADTTTIPFTHFKAKEWGINIELLSSTKYISGGGTTIGGLIIDYASFDWKKSDRLGEIAQTKENDAFNFKLRKEIHRNLGLYMSPQVAFLQNIGLETLSIRYRTVAETTFKLTKILSENPKIQKVNYIGLPQNPFYSISKKQFGEFCGAMFTIDLDSQKTCFQFLNNLKIIRRATNLFDNQSLAIHPATTIYVNFSQEERREMNVFDTTIRFSIGLEELEDLQWDIEQALRDI